MSHSPEPIAPASKNSRSKAFWPLIASLILIIAIGAVLWLIARKAKDADALADNHITTIHALRQERDRMKSLLSLPPCEAATKIRLHENAADFSASGI